MGKILVGRGMSEFELGWYIGNFHGTKMFGGAIKQWLWWIGTFHGENNIGGLIGRKFPKGQSISFVE